MKLVLLSHKFVLLDQMRIMLIQHLTLLLRMIKLMTFKWNFTTCLSHTKFLKLPKQQFTRIIHLAMWLEIYTLVWILENRHKIQIIMVFLVLCMNQKNTRIKMNVCLYAFYHRLNQRMYSRHRRLKLGGSNARRAALTQNLEGLGTSWFA